MENFSDETPENTMPFFLEDYYSSMKTLLSQSGYQVSSSFLFGFLEKSMEDIQKLLFAFEKIKETMETLTNHVINEEQLRESIARVFAAKGEKIVEANQQAFDLGLNAIK